MKTGKNAELLARAYRALPGASLGSYYMPEDVEFVVGSGEGPWVFDADGKRYVDYLLGSGPMLLGHAHPAINEAVRAQLAKGTSYYALNEPAIELAETIIGAVPCAEAVKFCGSGAEATFYALRLARALTGRDKIMKFEGGYHGHHDYVMMSTTPTRLQPFPAAVPDTAGIPRDVRGNVLVAPFNDLAECARIVDAHREDLAAVIIEPQSRLIEPHPGFLAGLRELTRKAGVLLIFDEVVTGFRLAWGGAQEIYGVTPDLACYGKVIGGGLPLAAVAGPRNVIELANPRKKGAPDYTYISGTLNGNPLAAVAGLAALRELRRPGAYERLNAAGERMRAGLARIAGKHGIPAQVVGRGPMANIYFTGESVYDYRSSCKVDKMLTQQLTVELIRRGHLANLATKMYLSLVHGDAEIDSTLQAFDDAITAVR